MREAIRDLENGDARAAVRGFWRRHRVMIVALLLLGVVLFAVNHAQQNALHEYQVGANQRRDQTCAFFARDYDKKIQSRKDTIAYLRSLPESEKKLTINKVIRANLPKMAAEIATSNPPAYCNQLAGEEYRP